MKKLSQNSKKQPQEIFQVAEIEIVYKPKVKASDRPKINNPRQVYEMLMQNWDHNRIEFIEQFKVILINRGSRVLGIYEVSTGGLHETVVDKRVILAIALKTGASSIILAHNHPSGNPDPSDNDKELTAQIEWCCRFHHIRLRDHIIVCPNSYFSFGDKGLL